mmetsp:Transcript_3042/g.9293  ORF Transcript_3042/g.9293 Transcript_3042/m.9293 type:complete len:304 (+) Transcript_3042:344-1255(+)
MNQGDFWGATPLYASAEPCSPEAELEGAELTVLCLTDCRSRHREITKLSEKLAALGYLEKLDLVLVALPESKIEPASHSSAVPATVGECSATLSVLEEICARVAYILGGSGTAQGSASAPMRLTSYSCDLRSDPVLLGADLVATTSPSERRGHPIASDDDRPVLWSPWGSSLWTRLSLTTRQRAVSVGRYYRHRQSIVLSDKNHVSLEDVPQGCVLFVHPAVSVCSDRDSTHRSNRSDSPPQYSSAPLQEPGGQVTSGAGSAAVVKLASLRDGWCSIISLQRIQEGETKRWTVTGHQDVFIYD